MLTKSATQTSITNTQGDHIMTREQATKIINSYTVWEPIPDDKEAAAIERLLQHEASTFESLDNAATQDLLDSIIYQ